MGLRFFIVKYLSISLTTARKLEKIHLEFLNILLSYSQYFVYIYI